MSKSLKRWVAVCLMECCGMECCGMKMVPVKIAKKSAPSKKS